MADDEERIALFIDHENLSIGAREIGRSFDVGPIMEALAERGRVVARRAYADWTLFADDRRSLVEHNCELIDIPQRTGAVRKNAADIKLAVDAMELAYERGFVSTFVIASGDSDFTPLVAALRGLNRRVIGIGVKGSTSNLLPPACDEFLFYDRLPGVSEPPVEEPKRSTGSGNGAAKKTSGGAKRKKRQAPTGGELLRQLERNGALALADGAAPGDPSVDFPPAEQGDQAFALLQATVKDLQGDDEDVPLSGLKDQLRKRNPGWSEKDLGYAGFLQFVRAAASSGAVTMEWDEEEGDYFIYVPS